MDRRQRERYEVEAPVRFSWKDPKDVRQRCQGLLNDISGGGMFVSTSDSPPTGTRVHLRVALRTVFAGTELIVRAFGQVIRVESSAEAKGRSGFAVTIKKFVLRSDHRKKTDLTTNRP
jgi:PilZ domain